MQTTTNHGATVDLESPSLGQRAIKQAAARAVAMPDESAALQAMFTAYLRLKDLGWNDAVYCPKDGSPLLLIEAGSTGIHEGVYQGKWPEGGWWVHDGETYPSRPILFKIP